MICQNIPAFLTSEKNIVKTPVTVKPYSSYSELELDKKKHSGSHIPKIKTSITEATIPINQR